jgi:hypothetical protein
LRLIQAAAMADDTTSATSRSSEQFQGGRRPGGAREGGNREGGNREPGGFRIRLSDNEMRAARAIQDAFRLRSTVAALGFSIRTLAQLLEEGKLDELVAEQRAQAGNRGDRREERRGGERGERRSERSSAPRINPFARPSKPAPAPAPAATAEEEVGDSAPSSDVAVEATAEQAPEATTASDATSEA